MEGKRMGRALLYLFLFSACHAQEALLLAPALPAEDINATIARIEALSVSGHLKEARSILSECLKKEPDMIRPHLLYAKFLYWDAKPILAKEAIEPYKMYDKELYEKIYTAWAVTMLKKEKTPRSKIEFIRTLMPSVQESYDVRWKAIESYIRIKQFKKALSLTKALVRKYPQSREAQERLATLLFWNGQFQNSLHQYITLQKQYGNHYKKQIRQLKIIVHKRPAHKVRPKKSAPDIAQKTQKKHPAKHMAGAGIHHASFSDKRYKDETYYIEATLPINTYTLYIKAQHTDRYGLKDSKISGEFYPKMPEPYWGYLSFSFTPQADFFSKESLGWHQFYGYKQWQFGLGYEWGAYKSENIGLLSGEYSYYFTDSLYGRQAFYYVPSNHSWALLSELKYQTPQHLEWHITYTVSASNEKKEASNLLGKTDKKHIELGGEHPLYQNYTIGMKLGKEWLKSEYQNKYRRSYFDLSLRYRW